MSEKLKMLAGENFLANDDELAADRLKAKQLCHQFNQLAPDLKLESERLICQLFNRCESHTIEVPFYCDYGFNISVGSNFYANHGVIILDAAPVQIGDDVLLAPGVMITTVTHPIDAQKRRLGLESALPITIGNNVWVGMGAKILPGVTIGDNAVVAAGAVVVKNVASNTVVAGVPATLLRPI
ncbi:sugar O-acetyltransferase [Shewanella sp. UCD-KL12]|uniref:sugar O-acetyltransferase n=1 Tax=Shewanella sp. UCD-KL12 TaxID=1917163 RepID=UPI00117E60B7|nr:sugar O-acetyltransferase [Shewanella sp. UCD-KL12]